MPLMAGHSRQFQHRLRAWFRAQARDLPWRHTRDPYAILVSEFMLQQTQVVSVLPYYARWLVRFPDIASLAAADEQEILSHWQGLGYYSRARNLHATARTILTWHGGIFPRTLPEMRALPGLGDYTAGAVLTFAFDARVPIVDANIARVLARLFDLRLPIDSAEGKRRLWELAASLLPARHPGEHNAALMELGALICQPKPRCAECPVRDHCQTTDPASLPIKRPRAVTTRKVERALFIEDGDRILLRQRTANPWRGMWVLPPLPHPPAPVEQPILTHRYGITRYLVTLEIFPAAPLVVLPDTDRWFTAAELATLPMPTPHRRVLEALLGTVFGSARVPRVLSGVCFAPPRKPCGLPAAGDVAPLRSPGSVG